MNCNNTKIYLREWKIAKILNVQILPNNVDLLFTIFITIGKEKLKNDNLLDI